MAPDFKVINHGATKTQRAAPPRASAQPFSGRACTAPSAATDTSVRRPAARRAPRTPQPAATNAIQAATHSRTGWRGSRASAALAGTAATVAAAAMAASQSRRSRAEGCRTVHPSITQIRLKTRVPFVPPKPNEFLSATPIFRSRAVLAQ